MNKPLTIDDELEIIHWCEANPQADLASQIQAWKDRFKCSEFSIYQVFVKRAVGILKDK